MNKAKRQTATGKNGRTSAMPRRTTVAARPADKSGSPSESQKQPGPRRTGRLRTRRIKARRLLHLKRQMRNQTRAPAANEKRTPASRQVTNVRRPSDPTTAASPAQPAGSNSSPSNKDVASDKPKAESPTTPQTKNPAEPPAPRHVQQRSAIGGEKHEARRRTIRNTASGECLAGRESKRTAKDATAATKQQPANGKQPAANAGRWPVAQHNLRAAQQSSRTVQHNSPPVRRSKRIVQHSSR